MSTLEMTEVAEKAAPTFVDRIVIMNNMYKLQNNGSPTLPVDVASRLQKFKKTLSDEVGEIDLIVKMVGGDYGPDHVLPVPEIGSPEHNADVITAIADLLGDVVVYCRSEALKYGINLEEVLEVIMDSNESKLGPDGIPVYNAEGKFLKDMRTYWQPEPMIKNLLTCDGPVQVKDWDTNEVVDADGRSLEEEVEQKPRVTSGLQSYQPE